MEAAEETLSVSKARNGRSRPHSIHQATEAIVNRQRLVMS